MRVLFENWKGCDIMKMTQKQVLIGGLLLNHKEKGLNVYEFIKTYKKELEKQNIDTQKINSVNATLASLASKELVVKTKVAYNDKMVTNYKPTDLLDKVINTKENK